MTGPPRGTSLTPRRPGGARYGDDERVLADPDLDVAPIALANGASAGRPATVESGAAS